jgi:hypothetical protein
MSKNDLNRANAEVEKYTKSRDQWAAKAAAATAAGDHQEAGSCRSMAAGRQQDIAEAQAAVRLAKQGKGIRW